MKLSIVIPIYNVEKYIEKCLMSCLHQDLPANDYEIIIVNDGTPDDSMSIVERIAQKYSNIRIINQENQGLSMARNNGAAIARGEYIWFIDSDDYIEENCLMRITNHLTGGLDILQLQYRWVYEDGKASKDIPFCTIDGIQSGCWVTEQGGLPAPAQFSVLRSKFLKENKLEFVRGIYHEDSEFKPRATYLAKKIASDTVASYNYLQRTSGSITSTYKLKNGLDAMVVMNNLLDFTNEHNMSRKSLEAFYCKIGLNMNTVLFGYRQLSVSDKASLKAILRKNKPLFASMRKSKNLKYQLEGICFGIGISFGLMLHRLMR